MDADGVGWETVMELEDVVEDEIVNVVLSFEAVTVSFNESDAVPLYVSVFLEMLLVRLVDVDGGAVKDKLPFV